MFPLLTDLKQLDSHSAYVSVKVVNAQSSVKRLPPHLKPLTLVQTVSVSATTDRSRLQWWWSSSDFSRKTKYHHTSLHKIWEIFWWRGAKRHSESSELLWHLQTIQLTAETLFVMKWKCWEKTSLLFAFEGFGSLNWRIWKKQKPNLFWNW